MPSSSFQAVDPRGAVHELDGSQVACFNHQTGQITVLPDGHIYSPLRNIAAELTGLCRLGDRSVNPAAVCWIRHQNLGMILVHHENWLHRYNANAKDQLAHLIEAASLLQVNTLSWMSLPKATTWTGKTLRMLNSPKIVKDTWRSKAHSWIKRRWARVADDLWINPGQLRLLCGSTFPTLALDRGPSVPLANLPDDHQAKARALPWFEIGPEVKINLEHVRLIRQPENRPPWVDLGMGVVLSFEAKKLAKLRAALENRAPAREMAAA